MVSAVMRLPQDERFRQIITGLSVLGLVLVLTVGVRVASYLPGITGEFFTVITGFLSTPILLEISFAALGFVIVLALNSWRRHREGDEFVEFDFPDDPSLPKNGNG